MSLVCTVFERPGFPSLRCRLGVNPSHPSVNEHPHHETVKSAEEKKERREERERQMEQEAKGKERELQITLLWKPHMGNVPFFKENGRE